jgi:RimJ/RimL family protein N-acetyltransferase
VTPIIDYPIKTERLLLRPLTLDDVDAVHAYQSNEEVCRYVPFEPRSREVVIDRIENVLKSQLSDEGDAASIGVEDRETGALMGDIMLAWRSVEHQGAEIGWAIHPDYQGKGFAVEAASAVLALAFGVFDFHRVVARVDVLNVASIALAGRLGMRQEAHLIENEWFKGRWADEFDFAILGSEWRAAHS